MGREERNGAQAAQAHAARQARAQAAQVLEFREAVYGPLLRHAVYRGGCPKCGATVEALRASYCSGAFPIADMQRCPMHGEHLHGKCDACKFEWREETKDADDSPRASRVGAVGDAAWLARALDTVAPATELPRTLSLTPTGDA